MHPDPLLVGWNLDGLVAADGHVVHCDFRARIRAVATPTEQRMLAETLMGSRQRVTVDEARAHFQEALRGAAARLVATAPAADWLTGNTPPPQPSPGVPGDGVRAHGSPLQDALITAANALAFTSGVEILPPFELVVDSPSVTNARIEARQQQAIEQITRRRAEIMQAVLAAGDDPAALPPIPDATDEQAYHQHMTALLDVQAMRHPRATLHAIAGQMLLSIDVAAGEIGQPRQLALPDVVGAFRSINAVPRDPTPHLLLGGQRGLLLMHPDFPSQAAAYVDPTLASQMGFNDALLLRGHLWATHSQAGLVCWAIDHPDQPVRTIPIAELAASPRHLTILDDRLLFSVGAALYTLAADAAPARIADLPAPPLAMERHNGRVCILRSDGALEQRDPRTLDVLNVQPAVAGDATHGTILHCMNQPLGAVMGESGTIELRGGSTEPLRTYRSGHRNVRLLRATAAYIAALSADRTRVVLWSIRQAQPLADLHLGAVARHRVADFIWM